MVPAPQDALITLPQEHYGRYLEQVYRWMAEFVPEDADIIEVGVRPKTGDRGVISRRVIPHKSFVGVDRTSRGDRVLDVLKTPIQADVIISTCVLHHTAVGNVPLLLTNLQAPILLFSGPNAAVLPKLFGDHKWHIEIEKLEGWLRSLGYQVVWEPSGLSEPRCEVLVAAMKPLEHKARG